MFELFKYKLSKKKIILLLDGYDEVYNLEDSGEDRLKIS